MIPSVFISYSWDDDAHKEWVKGLAQRLRADGIDAVLDRWETVPGDMLAAFMEKAIRENDFVLIICTLRYKMRSDSREGGVGYEGDIMTSEVQSSQNHRKFIPVLRRGTWQEASPTWVMGKRYIDLSSDPFPEQEYLELLRTLRGENEQAPPVGQAKPGADDETTSAAGGQSQPVQRVPIPNPPSTEEAVAKLKQYISSPEYRIPLFDLISNQVDQLIETVSGNGFLETGEHPPDQESVTARVRGFDSASSTLISMAIIGGFWAEEEHISVWQHAMQRLGSKPMIGGYDVWIGLQRYPATLLLYALGLGAVASNRLSFLNSVLSTNLHHENTHDSSSVLVLPPFCLFEHGGQQMKILEGMDRRYAPLNDWIFNTMQPYSSQITSSNEQFISCFDKLEVLIALGFAYHSKKNGSWHDWMPPGAFGYRYQRSGRHHIIDEISSSLVSDENNSPFVTCGIFGSSFQECRGTLSQLATFISELGWR